MARVVHSLLFIAIAMIAANPAHASFTASFQPCDLPAYETGKGTVLARCNVDFAGTSGVVELRGKAPDAVSSIVFMDDNGKTVQAIEIAARPFIDPENVSIVVRDMNFDGWPDFGLRDFSREGQNIAWAFWLWNDKGKRFEPHKQLSELPNPEVSLISKTVRAHIVEAKTVRTDVYVWQKDRLVLKSSSTEKQL